MCLFALLLALIGEIVGHLIQSSLANKGINKKFHMLGFNDGDEESGIYQG